MSSIPYSPFCRNTCFEQEYDLQKWWDKTAELVRTYKAFSVHTIFSQVQEKHVSLTWLYSTTTKIFIDPVTTHLSTVAKCSLSSTFSQNPPQQSTIHQMSHLDKQSHQ